MLQVGSKCCNFVAVLCCAVLKSRVNGVAFSSLVPIENRHLILFKGSMITEQVINRLPLFSEMSLDRKSERQLPQPSFRSILHFFLISFFPRILLLQLRFVLQKYCSRRRRKKIRLVQQNMFLFLLSTARLQLWD